MLCVSSVCVLGVLGGSISWWGPCCTPLWISILSGPGGEETLHRGFHQNALCCDHQPTRLRHSPGASLHRHGRGESWDEGEGGIGGCLVFCITRKAIKWKAAGLLSVKWKKKKSGIAKRVFVHMQNVFLENGNIYKLLLHLQYIYYWLWDLSCSENCILNLMCEKSRCKMCSSVWRDAHRGKQITEREKQ